MATLDVFVYSAVPVPCDDCARLTHGRCAACDIAQCFGCERAHVCVSSYATIPTWAGSRAFIDWSSVLENAAAIGELEAMGLPLVAGSSDGTGDTAERAQQAIADRNARVYGSPDGPALERLVSAADKALGWLNGLFGSLVTDNAADRRARRWLLDTLPNGFSRQVLCQAIADLRYELTGPSNPPISGTVLRCPHGHAGPFGYLEDITIERRVYGLDSDGRLVADGQYESEGWDEISTRPRLVCNYDNDGPSGHYCGAQFALPHRSEDIDWDGALDWDPDGPSEIPEHACPLCSADIPAGDPAEFCPSCALRMAGYPPIAGGALDILPVAPASSELPSTPDTTLRDAIAAHDLAVRMHPRPRKVRPTVASGYHGKPMPRYRVPGSSTCLLSVPEKMPCYSWSLPAGFSCPFAFRGHGPNGEQAICEHCYAENGRYRMMPVINAQWARFNWTRACLKQVNGHTQDEWVATMVAAIADTRTPYFRVHDSGDLFSLEYTRLWVRVARALPTVAFWVPTRSYRAPWESVIRELANLPNVTVRPSALHFGAPAPDIAGYAMGSTATDRGYSCPARNQNNECRDCRMCWNAPEQPISYARH